MSNIFYHTPESNKQDIKQKYRSRLLKRLLFFFRQKLFKKLTGWAGGGVHSQRTNPVPILSPFPFLTEKMKTTTYLVLP